MAVSNTKAPTLKQQRKYQGNGCVHIMFQYRTRDIRHPSSTGRECMPTSTCEARVHGGLNADFAFNYSEQIERWCTDMLHTQTRFSQGAHLRVNMQSDR